MFTHEDVIADARSVLAQQGLTSRDIEILSPRAAGRKAGRCTLRAVLADGSAIKVRVLESAREASRLAGLRVGIHPAFGPVVGRSGAMLLEAWIDGNELSPAEAGARAEEVGAILGRLHATELPSPPRRIATRARRDRAAEQLGRLADEQVLSTDLSHVLSAELVRCDPAESVQALIHLDYCPENLVVDSAGGIHVIDNEWMTVDAPGLDLGRTFTRWPMSREEWGRFLAGYSTTAACNPGPLRFWMIVMAVAGATIRLNKSSTELAVPLARLHELASPSPTQVFE